MGVSWCRSLPPALALCLPLLPPPSLALCLAVQAGREGKRRKQASCVSASSIACPPRPLYLVYLGLAPLPSSAYHPSTLVSI